MKQFTPKKKQGKANWTKAFPNQLRALEPQNDASRVILKTRGEVSRQVYKPIADLFKKQYYFCQACSKIPEFKHRLTHATQDVHHMRGRSGLLLFDVRFFLPTCREAHRWIHDPANQAEAKKLGLLIERNL